MLEIMQELLLEMSEIMAMLRFICVSQLNMIISDTSHIHISDTQSRSEMTSPDLMPYIELMSMWMKQFLDLIRL